MLLGCAVIFMMLTGCPGLKTKVPVKLPQSHVSDSPIMASGGSMTFRASTPLKWSCYSATQHPYCVTQTQFTASSIALDGIMPANNTNPVPAGFADLSQFSGWKILMYPRAVDGSLVKSSFVEICQISKPASPLPQTPPPCVGSGYILLQAHGNGVGGRPVSLVDSNASNDSSTEQYYDPDCEVHPSGTAVPGCEHPGTITLVDQKDYVCNHGACVITFN